MKSHTTSLVDRRKRLLAQAAAQRTALAQSIEPWRPTLAVVDQGLTALRYVKRHPLLLAGGIALIAVVRPGRSWSWLQRGMLAWQAVRKFRGA